eukprot:jgi/Botrbrau1/4453/Bobra.0348s0039.1
MAGLLKRIAVQLADRVEESVLPQVGSEQILCLEQDLISLYHTGVVQELFKMPAAEALGLLSTARAVLLEWYKQYMKVREQIELSDRDARWEFSRGILFERTNSMAEICGDLAEMVETLDSYYHFLGPELKAVTGDPQAINQVLEGVQEMAAEVEKIDFNVFDKACSTRWLLMKSAWATSNEDLKDATHDLIDTCFRKLRSAEAALGLLDSFRRMQARGPLKQQMESKLSDIMMQFSREMEATSNLFRTLKDKPPVTRNQPPIAGAISWSRALFGRCKRTMARLSELQSDLRSTPAGRQVHEEYRALARVMLDYEKQLWASWKDSGLAIALNILRQPLLRTLPDCSRIVVNLGEELEGVMREARGLDRLGFAIPETVASIALQHPQLRSAAEGLEAMMAKYDQATQGVSTVEAQLLNTHLTNLRKMLEPGFSPLNWTSLAVPEFISSVDKAVGEFQSLVTEVRKATAIADKGVAAILRSTLFVDPALSAPSAQNPMELQELIDGFERQRSEALDEVVKKYRGLAAVLTKVEALVTGTSSGRAPALAPYYGYWEGRVYRGLTSMVLRSLKALYYSITGRTKPGRGGGSAPIQPRPLFQVQY